MTSLLDSNAHWYLLRGTGIVAFLLLSVTVGLGIANVTRWPRRPSARVVTALVHRNASLLAVVFLAVHILTAVTDSYVSISLAAVVVPGTSGYRPLWVGLGALSLDLVVAVVVTSLVRARIGRRAWRAVHWLAYAAWPTALAHALGSGTDTGRTWTTVVYAVAGLGVLAAVAIRLRWRPPTGPPRAVVGPGVAGATATTTAPRRPSLAGAAPAPRRTP